MLNRCLILEYEDGRSHIHSKNVYHRDIKPLNLMMNRERNLHGRDESVICADGRSEKDWNEVKDIMIADAHDILLVIAGTVNIEEYLAVAGRARKSYLFIFNGELERDDVAELAKKHGLNLINKDVEDKDEKSNIKAYLRNALSEGDPGSIFSVSSKENNQVLALNKNFSEIPHFMVTNKNKTCVVKPKRKNKSSTSLDLLICQ